jgi:hypothetical protein
MSLKTYILNNNNWGTSQFDFEDLESPVTRIHSLAHENDESSSDSSGEQPTNHWTVLLTTSATPVHLEAIPNEPGRPGMVVLASIQNELTHNAAHVVSADVPSGITVESLVAIIVKRKRDNYTFHPIGEGCRYWLSVISEDFLEEGIIDKQKSDAIIDAMGNYWPPPSGTPGVPRPMRCGTFNG